MNLIKTFRQEKSDRTLAILFLLPAIALICCITLIPIFFAFRTSLFSTNYAELVDFIGFKNYIAILSTASGWQKIIHSILYVILSLVMVIPLGIGLGCLLNRKIKAKGLLRTVIIIPWVLSQTVTALLWKWLLNSSFGPIVYLVYSVTGVKLDFFNTPLAAQITVILANVWSSFPIVLILVLAALQTIPTEMNEAARVDGASGWQIFTRITLPMIKTTIVTAIIMQSMEYFNMVTLIYVLTAGGPFGATETTSVIAFKEGFDFWHMGIGAAYSVIIFFMNVIFSAIYVKMIKSKKED